MRVIRTVLGWPFIFLVKIYQWIISPIFPQTCRYTPTCSSYMIEAIKVWGPIKGVYLGVKRIASCNPWGGHGHDPVPEQEKAIAFDVGTESDPAQSQSNTKKVKKDSKQNNE